MTPEQQAALERARARVAARQAAQGRLAQNRITPLEGLIQGGGQALTGGFLDEAVNAGQALFSKKPFSQAYKEQRALTEPYLSRITEDQLVPFIAGNVGGGLLGAGAAATTKAGKAISGMLGSGSAGARIAKGALAGGASGAVYGAGGSESGERLSGAATGGLLGAGLGAAVPAVSSLAKSSIEVPENVKDLAKKAVDKYGIPLSTRQVTGSKFLGRLEDVGQNLPFSGNEKFREKQLTAFNQAVSKTFGQNIDNFTMEAWDEAFKKAGQPYEELLTGKTINVQDDALNAIDEILDEAAGNVSEDVVAIVRNNADKVKRELEKGTVSGETLNSLRSSLTKRAKEANPFARKYIAQLNNLVIDVSTEGNPEIAKQLREANKNYKNLNTALGAWDSETNAINPVKLENAVKSPRAYGLRSYAKGQAGELGELAQIGKSLLGQVGGSSTIPNLVAGGVGLGGIGGFAEPMAAVAAGGSLGLNALAQAANRNPRIVNRLLQQGETLPAIYSGGIRTPILSGQLGGMLGAQ